MGMILLDYTFVSFACISLFCFILSAYLIIYQINDSVQKHDLTPDEMNRKNKLFIVVHQGVGSLINSS